MARTSTIKARRPRPKTARTLHDTIVDPNPTGAVVEIDHILSTDASAYYLVRVPGGLGRLLEMLAVSK